MLPVVVILLTGSVITGAPSPEADRPALVLRRLADTHPRLLTAPELEPPPAGLAGITLETPDEATCVSRGIDLGVGTWVPQAWSQAINLLLERCVMLPVRFQGQLDEVGNLAVVAVDAESRVIIAEQAVERARERTPVGHSTWMLVAWTGGGLVIGALGGLVAGLVLAR